MSTAVRSGATYTFWSSDAVASTVEPPAGCVSLVVTAGTAMRVDLDGEVAALTNRVAPVGDVTALDVDRMLEQIEARDTGALDRALTHAIARGPAFSPRVRKAWEMLGPGTTIAEVADTVGWHRSHLTGRFAAEVGLTPKAVARIRRFRLAARLLAGPASLADVAAAAGYADQAHMTREFRALAGATPRAMRADPAFVQDGGNDLS